MYATSDIHFYHDNIMRFVDHRSDNFNNIVECNNRVIENYNNIITNEDTVYFVGDLSCGKHNGEKIKQEMLAEILNQMNGKKILIMGNHDKFSKSFYMKHFDEVHDFLWFGDTLMIHYPLVEHEYTHRKERNHLDKKLKAKTIIHGHVHDFTVEVDDGIKRVNVCVDYKPNNWSPVDITDLIKASST